MLQIISNGPATAGQPPADIDALIELLNEEPLDPTFEEYGNFISPDPDGRVLFLGNFAWRSHVFSIVTDEPGLIKTLTQGIRQNQAGEDYQNARAAYRPCSKCGKLAMFCQCNMSPELTRPRMRRFPHVNLRLSVPEPTMERTAS